MPEQRLNPYQPPPDPGSDQDINAPARVAFRLNDRLRRHAEAQYLLHWHPRLLLRSSLAMIFASSAVMIVSIQFSMASFAPTLMFVMVVSALIYSALVHRTKQRIRVALGTHGLSSDELLEVVADSRQLTLVTPLGTYRWPCQRLKLRRTVRGLLICPEPFLFIFVPKKSDFQFQTYRQFVRLAESRSRG